MENNFLIMGAHGGIGEALGLRLMRREGNHIIATMRDASKASDALRSGGVDMRAVDITDAKSVIAALSDFLLGPESGWITGQILHVDGGRSALRPKG